MFQLSHHWQTKMCHSQDKGKCYKRQLATIGELRMDNTIILHISEPCIVDDSLYEWCHIHPCLCHRVLK